jgi:hypothetical protein
MTDAPDMQAAVPGPAAEAWIPTDYSDEIIYHTTDHPSEWLIPRGSGHVLGDEHGEEPHDDVPLLKDGDIISFDRRTQHGTGTLTVHHLPDEDEDDSGWSRWTIDPPMPAAPSGADMHLCLADDPEIYGVEPGEVADELDPGTYTVRFYAWVSVPFRYDAKAGELVRLVAGKRAPA